jgi:hypothetical protein
MQYFYRAHCSPESVLEAARRYFSARGFAVQASTVDHARYTGPLGVVDVSVEIEGGHYTRVDIATGDLGESELDRSCKRFLAELHSSEDSGHVVRGAY